MTGTTSRWLAVAAVAGLAAMVLLPMTPGALIGAVPLAALMVAGVMNLPRWAIATAILMLPYFAYGVMEILTNPPERTRAIVFATISLAAFFAALDSMRRR